MHKSQTKKKSSSSKKERQSKYVAAGLKFGPLSSPTDKNNIIPSYSIINGPSSSQVVITLNKDQYIYSQPYVLSYMDKDIKLQAESKTSFLSGLKRLFFTSTSIYNSKFTASKDGCKLAFSNFLPGDIVPIIINPGQRITLKDNVLLCMTSNVNIKTGMKLKGIFVGENAFLTDVFVDAAESNNPGMVWISSYGGYEKLSISSGKSMMVESGLFLCAESNVDYEISTFGNIKTQFLTGSVIGMEFKGPCEVFLQNRNQNDLSRYIEQIATTVANRVASHHK